MSGPDPHQRLLISTKAILHREGRVLLVKGSRSEWDLPGGKLQHGEDLEGCLARELGEELGVSIDTAEVVGALMHHFHDDIVVIVYDCGSPNEQDFLLSDEHSDAGWFGLDQMLSLNIPENYRQLIASFFRGRTGSAADM